MQEKADLHIHTTFSDGSFTPEQIISMAKEKNLKAIAITDHDTISTYRYILENIDTDIEIIPGVEFTSFYDDREYHILGYFMDHNNEKMLQHFHDYRQSREERARVICQNINNRGFELDFDLIKVIAGKAPIGRPHIARAMMKMGYVRSSMEAFSRFLGDYSRLVVKKEKFPVEDCIKLIKEAGGIASLAHPPNSMRRDIVEKFVSWGLQAYECVHPSMSITVQKIHRKTADALGLIQTGGSDYHGTKQLEENNFGRYTVNYSVLDELKENIGK